MVIDDYVILSSHDSSLLQNDVIKMTANGWILHGGVSCALSESDDYRYLLFAQAMVKPANQPMVRTDKAALPPQGDVLLELEAHPF